MRDSVVFYRSFYEAIKDLPDADLAMSFKTIMEYGLNEVEPDTSGIEKTIYLLTKPQIDVNNKKYQNGTKGGRPKTEDKPNNNQSITKPEPKEKEKVNEKVKEKESIGHFTPPTEENVIGYCREMGYSVDASRFIDFYESKGWMVGKNKMKDWKASVRNWARQDKVQTVSEKPKKNQFHNFEQRETDYDGMAMERLKERMKEAEHNSE